MPRIILLICSGFSLLNTAYSNGQTLPKNPTAQQVVGYRMAEQQRWNSQQLPKNSVQYSFDRKTPGWQSLQFNFKKEKQPVINFSSVKFFSVPANSFMGSSDAAKLPFLRSNLFQQKKLYDQWRKESWLKDMKGSMWLREFLIQSKSRSNFIL